MLALAGAALQYADTAPAHVADPLVAQLVGGLRHNKRPVVVDEITAGKHIVEETQKASDITRREEAHIERHGDVPLHDA